MAPIQGVCGCFAAAASVATAAPVAVRFVHAASAVPLYAAAEAAPPCTAPVRLPEAAPPGAEPVGLYLLHAVFRI